MSNKTFGWPIDKVDSLLDDSNTIQYIELKLSALGFSIERDDATSSSFLDFAHPLLKNYQEKSRLASNYLCPVDQRIQNFLDVYLESTPENPAPRLPSQTFILDRHGLARTLSIPLKSDHFSSDIIHSYRIQQGVLHNPKHDRRTTKNSFHVAEGGFPIADDKLAVPKHVFKNMLGVALQPPNELNKLPFTQGMEEEAETMVSLLLRPIVCPNVPKFISEKSLETRFFVPGNMVANLDFVESIFGNAGDPFLPENDAGLDVEHWTGHTGCVILAPQLIEKTKKELGLPNIKDATDRQKRDGMCWEKEDELYNGGNAFKLTCRDKRGVVVTLIADNYFGYCKKEVKTQIGFSANLYGLSEEEHAGGASAFQSYNLGDQFELGARLPQNNQTFKDLQSLLKDSVDFKPEGYAIDKKYPDIIYVPEDSKFDLAEQTIKWKSKGKEQSIKLLASKAYVLPSGYKIHMKKQEGSASWHLVGTVGEGILCHKPCTVSGGGKSEISKSIADAMFQGPVFVASFHKDMDMVEEVMSRDFGDRFREKFKSKRKSRAILDPRRTLGSVIKLFTPADEYSDEYNEWLNNLPNRIKAIIYVVKRHYDPAWKGNWREHFSVDIINGHLGHELKYDNTKLVANYLRVGHELDGSWRTFKLRQDFMPCQKIQAEDDITASVVVPRERLKYLNPEYSNPSVKIVQNCESRLFQRPDDCIIRGYDKQAEKDLAGPRAFLSNYEPLSKDDGVGLIQDAKGFDAFTKPIQNMVANFVGGSQREYFASSAQPRIMDGKATKNPRYLQNRPDLMDPKGVYLGELGIRLFRKIPMDEPLYRVVNAVLPGRRMNPADPENNIPPLAVYNPIHYQELPELFIDFICSVTGKSPSTTGFGSEGALTKGPFNALWATADLNTALVSFILCQFDGFSSAAGYIGPKYRVDHDISLLIPEIWSRMSVEERKPSYLIENGYLEKLEDFSHNGKTAQASLLGYRITMKFVHHFFGRIFNSPDVVLTDEMLKPELQDMDMFAGGIENLVTTQRVVAEHYFNDGSIEAACPPIHALLHIMKNGNFEGKDINHPDIRAMFTYDYLLSSDWYKERLLTKQARDVNLWKRHVDYLDQQTLKARPSEGIRGLNLGDRLEYAKEQLKTVQSDEYIKNLQGTLGADPLK